MLTVQLAHAYKDQGFSFVSISPGVSATHPLAYTVQFLSRKFDLTPAPTRHMRVFLEQDSWSEALCQKNPPLRVHFELPRKHAPSVVHQAIA